MNTTAYAVCLPTSRETPKLAAIGEVVAYKYENCRYVELCFEKQVNQGLSVVTAIPQPHRNIGLSVPLHFQLVLDLLNDVLQLE